METDRNDLLTADELYSQLKHLKAIAQLDSLTGVYNRGAAQPLMDDAVSEATQESPVALLAIDLDEFKLINDTLGHQQGDSLLMDFAEILRSIFSKEDILCRIGGDEFCVVVRNPGTKLDVGKKAADVLSKLREVYRRGYPILGSCSIGGAFAPFDGTNFKTVFHNADAALYQVKSSGKNSVMFYGGFVAERDSCAPSSTDAEVADGTLWARIAQHAFQVIYRCSDMNIAMQLIVELIGKRLEVSRVGILEAREDGAEMHCTFQWHAKDRKPLFTKLLREQFGDAYRLMNRDGSFVCSDAQALKGPFRTVLDENDSCSVVLCAVREQECLKGCVWVDYCDGPHQWGRSTRTIVTFLSELISVTLLRERALEKERNRRLELEKLLNQ